MRRFPTISAALWGATSLGIVALFSLPQPEDAAQAADPDQAPPTSSTPDYSAFIEPLPRLSAADLDARKLSPLPQQTGASPSRESWSAWASAVRPREVNGAVGSAQPRSLDWAAWKPAPMMWVAVAANVRSGPSVRHYKLTTLPAAKQVIVAETQGNWSRVLLPNGSTGWVASSLLSQSPTDRPSRPAGERAKRDTPDKQMAMGEQRTSSRPPDTTLSARLGGNAVLRSSPSRMSPRSHRLAQGEVVTVVEKRNGWVRVVLKSGATGWVQVR